MQIFVEFLHASMKKQETGGGVHLCPHLMYIVYHKNHKDVIYFLIKKAKLMPIYLLISHEITRGDPVS